MPPLYDYIHICTIVWCQTCYMCIYRSNLVLVLQPKVTLTTCRNCYEVARIWK